MNETIVLSTRVQGYDEALETVRRVANVSERQKIMRGAIGATGGVVKKALLADPRFPTGTVDRKVPGYGVIPAGSLRKTVRVSTKLEKGHAMSQIAGAFGVRGAVISGNRKKGIYWAHFIEGGVRPHSTSKGARKGRRGKRDFGQIGRLHPGRPAGYQMRNAAQSTTVIRNRVFSDYIEKRLAKLQRTGSA